MWCSIGYSKNSIIASTYKAYCTNAHIYYTQNLYIYIRMYTSVIVNKDYYNPSHCPRAPRVNNNIIILWYIRNVHLIPYNYSNPVDILYYTYCICTSTYNIIILHKLHIIYIIHAHHSHAIWPTSNTLLLIPPQVILLQGTLEVYSVPQ